MSPQEKIGYLTDQISANKDNGVKFYAFGVLVGLVGLEDAKNALILAITDGDERLTFEVKTCIENITEKYKTRGMLFIVNDDLETFNNNIVAIRQRAVAAVAAPPLELPENAELFEGIEMPLELRAGIIAAFEAADIFQAYLDPEKFREFLERHGDAENPVRLAALTGITQAIGEAFSGIDLDIARQAVSKFAEIWNKYFTRENLEKLLKISGERGREEFLEQMKGNAWKELTEILPRMGIVDEKMASKLIGALEKALDANINMHIEYNIGAGSKNEMNFVLGEDMGKRIQLNLPLPGALLSNGAAVVAAGPAAVIAAPFAGSQNSLIPRVTITCFTGRADMESGDMRRRQGEIDEMMRQTAGMDYRLESGKDYVMAAKILSRKSDLEEAGIEGAEMVNSGVKTAGGETLWIGKTREGLIFYSEGAREEEIAKEIGSNRIVRKAAAEYIEEKIGIRVEVKSFNLGFMMVDSETKGISYDSNGIIAVGIGEYELALERGKLSELSAAGQAVLRADAQVRARSILHILDDVFTVEEFMEYLVQHVKMGNGQIAVGEEFVRRMIEEKGEKALVEFLNSAKVNGAQVFVIVGEESGWERYDKLGFAGYVFEGSIYNGLLDLRTKIKEVSCASRESFERTIAESAGYIAAIKNSELKALLKEGRTTYEINKIIRALHGIDILRIFAASPIRAEEAYEVGINFEIVDIPADIDIETLEDMVRRGDYEVDNLMRGLHISERGGEISPIIAYISKVQNQGVENEEAVRRFIEGITMRVLAVKEMRRAGKGEGLIDRNHEILLARAIKGIIEYEREVGKEGSGTLEELGAAEMGGRVNVYSLIDQNLTAEEAFRKLNEILISLNREKKSGAMGVSVDVTVRELILTFSEARSRINVEERSADMELKAYYKILSAA
jgi:hypothetical protein